MAGKKRQTLTWIKRAVLVGLAGVSLCALCLLGLNLWVVHGADALVVEDLNDLEDHHVALVLGTSPKLRGGYTNLYFSERIEAAMRLYEAGKVSHLLVSGDNRTRKYNEPEAMRRALIKAGVAPKDITLDYAGLRTLDSVVRARAVFGQERVVIISQKDHLKRALFIARAHGIEAVGYVAQDPVYGRSPRVRAREALARVKAIMDVHVLDKQPRHLGDPVSIPGP